MSFVTDITHHGAVTQITWVSQAVLTAQVSAVVRAQQCLKFCHALHVYL